MSLIKTPMGVAAVSNEVEAIMTRDDRITPHVVMLRAKLRSLAYRFTPGSVPDGVQGSTAVDKILIAYLPAGRVRVMFHRSTICSKTAIQGSLGLGEYTSLIPPFDQVEEELVTKSVSLTANTITTLEELNNEDKGMGMIYTSREDIPLYFVFNSASTATAVAALQFQGHIIYGQE